MCIEFIFMQRASFVHFAPCLVSAAQVLLWPGFWRGELQWGSVSKNSISSGAAHAHWVRQRWCKWRLWKLSKWICVRPQSAVLHILSIFCSSVLPNCQLLCVCVCVYPQRQRHLFCIWPDRCREDAHHVGYLSWETRVVRIGSSWYFCSHLRHTNTLTITGVCQFLWNLLWPALRLVGPPEKVCKCVCISSMP